MLQISRRAAQIAPSATLAIDTRAKALKAEGKDVVGFGAGEPDFDTPEYVRAAAHRAIDEGRTRYTPVPGTLTLRKTIAEKFMKDNGLDYDVSQIIVSSGAKQSLFTALSVLVNDGDEVLIPEPSYVSYAPGVVFAGGVPVPVPTSEQNGFALMPEALAAAVTPRTKAVILPYPNNPTGAVLDRPLLERLRDVFVENDLIVISDEIYSELTYTEEGHTSIASLPGMHERTIVLNGFSKAFAMTGWRMGYLCAPAAFTDVMCKIHQYTILCAPRQGQVAAEEALRQGREDGYADVVSMRESYNQRRRLMVQSFRDMGLSCFEPLGAFYVFPGIQKTGLSSEDFCQRLLREKKVVTVPGTAFGASGEGYIRCSYATGIAKLTEALDRMADFVASL